MAAPVVDLVVVDFVVVLVYYYMRIIDDVPYLQNWLYIGLSWDAGDYDYDHTDADLYLYEWSDETTYF